MSANSKQLDYSDGDGACFGHASASDMLSSPSSGAPGISDAPLKSPKSPISSYQRFGWVFGEPLEVFPPSKKPSECDIVRYWMFLYDRRSNSPSKMSGKVKNAIISDVVKSVVEHWTIHNFATLLQSTETITTRLKRVLSRVEKIKSANFEHRKFDLEWIAMQKKAFESVFDINKSKSKTAPPQNLQDSDIEMVSYVYPIESDY